MYNVPEFIPKVYLIHRDGRKWEFKNIEKAADTLWYQGYLGRYREAPLIAPHFKEARPFMDYDANGQRDDLVGSVIYHDYIVRDEVGEIITVDDLKDARKPRHNKWNTRHDDKVHITEKFFRKMPIPHTGRGGWRSGYRHVRTRSEIRENEFLKYDEDAIEYDIKPRTRRTQDLPTLWDDIWRNDYRSRNWKRHRKTQWKEKK